MEFIKKIKKISIVTAALAAVTGFMFVIFPNQCIQFGALLVGIALMILGLSGIINYFRKEVGSFILTLSIIVAIAGLFVCLKYEAIISFIIMILGIGMVASGISNLIVSIKVVTFKSASSFVTTFLAVLNIVFGIAAILNSNDVSEMIVRFVGVALLSYFALGLISYFQVKSAINKAKKEKAEDHNEVLPNGDIKVEGEEIE